MRYKELCQITVEENEPLGHEKTAIQQQIEKTVKEQIKISNEQFETKEADYNQWRKETNKQIKELRKENIRVFELERREKLVHNINKRGKSQEVIFIKQLSRK